MDKRTYYGLVRVNKTRARKLYNSEYEVLLTMNGFRCYNHYPDFKAIWKVVDDENFDRLVADYYETNKGTDYSYTVEYWVSESDDKEYVRVRNKDWQRKYKAKKCL